MDGLGLRDATLIDAHLRKLRKRDTIDAAEERAIRGLVAETRRVKAHQVLVRKEELLDHSILLIDGWLGRATDLPSGVRVFTEVHVAGDFADLHSFTLKRLDHDVVVLADSIIAIVPHERLAQLTRDFPHLSRVYWFTTNLDAAIHRQWLVSIGRSAASRMAHLFCELWVRLEIGGLAYGHSYDFPLTQEQLASCLNLTAVHVNRTLQALRGRSLIELANKRLTMPDFAALRALADFDPSYLYLESRPR